MDQTQLQQKIAEYYLKLPQDLQVFFAGQSWITDIKNISIKYNFNSDQISILTTETTLVLICIISMADYVKIIETELKLPLETFERVLGEIGETIFKDIFQKTEETYLKNLALLEKENAVAIQDVPIPPYKIRDEAIIKLENKSAEEELVDQTKKDVNFLAKKLNEPTLTPSTVSDHSLPSLNKDAHQSNPIKNSHDPYREGIEL